MRSMFRSAIAALAAATTVTALVGCGSTPEETGLRSLTIGVDVPAIGVTGNPFEGTYLFTFGRQPSYEPLIVWDKETEDFIPWLAEEFTLSDDRKTLTLQLRDDVDFIDGEHLDAAGLEAYLTALFASEGFYLPGEIVTLAQTQVRATDEYTVELTTSAPISFNYLDNLAYVPIASPATIDDPASLADAPIGTGPYLIDEVVPEVSMSFVRNPDYWNPDAYPYDEITFLAFSDQVAALNALKSGQIDATNLSPQLAVEAQADGFALATGPSGYSTLLVTDIDGSVVPALADVRVRQAINMAFDREAILESIDLGLGVASSQPLTPAQREYIDGGDTRYVYDVEGAKALLAEAGYADGFDVVIPSASGSVAQYPVDYEPIVQQSLAEIGIRVSFEPVGADLGALIDAWGSGKYAIAMVSPAFTNTLNALGLFGPELVADQGFTDLVSARDAATLDEQAEASQAIGEYLLDEAWFVPFSQPANIWASAPEVQIKADGTMDGVMQLRDFTPAP